MLQMVSVNGAGRKTLWLGLSDANRERLPVEPIVLDLPDDVNLAGAKLAIVAGPTEKVIAERLKALGLPIPEHVVVEPTPDQEIRWPR